MNNLNAKTLNQFLERAVEKLAGRWLLIGGSLLPALGIDIRSTVDIDFIGLGTKEKAQNLELMNLADSLGLNIESINQAAEFFLAKINYSDLDLIPLKESSRCKIFRPSINLYFKLKIARLSESDYLDCVYYYNYCKSKGDEINSLELSKIIRAAMKNKPTEEKLESLKKLLSSVA